MIGEVPVCRGGRYARRPRRCAQDHGVRAAGPGHLGRGVGQRVREVTVVVGVPAVAVVKATTLGCLRHHVIVLHKCTGDNVYTRALLPAWRRITSELLTTSGQEWL